MNLAIVLTGALVMWWGSNLPDRQGREESRQQVTEEDSPRVRAYRQALDDAARQQAMADPAGAFGSLALAHVLGQADFGLHWRVHVRMLRLAWSTGDLREVLGQAFRLLLVPLGHLFGRLPAGNTGRSNVSAFAPMPVAPDVQVLLTGKDRA